MLKRTEAEIMKNWQDRNKISDSSEVAVSIRCTAFNQERFISQALDSFLMQETTFPFEIVVHDDASQDNTADIIREYETAYPNIVKPIYETENQYSKHDGSLSKIISQACHGKYIAYCEGDDYWIDSHKLQKQFDFMEANSGYSMCVHNTIFHDSNGKKRDRLFNRYTKNRDLKEDDVFWGWTIHTSSYFVVRKCMVLPDFAVDFWAGDYAILTLCYFYGKIHYLSDVMSTYNYGIYSGVTVQNSVAVNGVQRAIRAWDDRIKYLSAYNEYTNRRYESSILKRIEQIQYIVSAILLTNANSYKEFQEARTYMMNKINNRNTFLRYPHESMKNYCKRRLLILFVYFGRLSYYLNRLRQFISSGYRQIKNCVKNYVNHDKHKNL